MRDILDELIVWHAQGKEIALATVVQTWGSAPRPLGANMALTADGEMAGSVSGGCVEGAVVEAGLEVLNSGGARLLHFGVADETAWEVGLACGGTIDVFVRPFNSSKIDFIKSSLEVGKSLASMMVIRGPEPILGEEIYLLEGGDSLSTCGPDLDHWALDQARRALAAGQPRQAELSLPDKYSEPVEIFINIELPPLTLIVVGGVHIAIPLTSLAKTLGYRTVIVDPRKMFGSQTRFPHVDQLIQAWPDKALGQVGINSSTAIAMLTHDPKIDDPALKGALRSPAFYIGALGSRKTHAARRQRLLEAGLSEAQLDRLYAPIGLDLGGRTPEEIALAVMAEIVQARNH